MQHGDEVHRRFRSSRDGGIPWMVILDADGNALITSDGPRGNCGYPLEPHEIDHFLTMLRSTSKRITADRLAQIRDRLDAYRRERESR